MCKACVLDTYSTVMDLELFCFHNGLQIFFLTTSTKKPEGQGCPRILMNLAQVHNKHVIGSGLNNTSRVEENYTALVKAPANVN